MALLMGSGRALLSAAREFDFSRLANVFLWLPADRLGLAHNAQVASWTDCSGAGRHAAQATAGNRPLYQTSGGPNGRPWVLFDGTDDYLATGNVTLAQPRTMIVVAKRTGNTTAFNRVLYGSATGEMGFDNAVNSYYSYAGGTVLRTAAADNAWHVVSTVQNGVGSVLRVDGVAAAGDVGGGSISGVPMQVGGSVTGSPLAGGIAEALIVAASLSTAELQRIERALAGKYGLAVS
ncbi:MAG: hypothetical protein NTZ05_19070 [Chloroflexi bacterium]|nr:hypothetical protein [Chloroflexota bacterium]